jgi:hypothetical protein
MNPLNDKDAHQLKPSRLPSVRHAGEHVIYSLQYGPMSAMIKLDLLPGESDQLKLE